MPVITKNHVCELCEAGCGLSVDVADGKPVAVRANDEDVFSKGFLCPKGLAALALDRDPDRLRTPVRRTPSGDFEPITWDEAFDLVAGRLLAVQNEHGRDSVAVYMGTPIVHKHGALLMRAALLGALRTKNSTSAGSQDTSTRFAASYFLYGSAFSLPVPDIDRTQYFLCIGANPLVSNGSLLTAPNVRARIAAIGKRGGKVVVVDPRRTETARAAHEHVAILPGADAAFVLALIQVLVQDGRIGEAPPGCYPSDAATTTDLLWRPIMGTKRRRESKRRKEGGGNSGRRQTTKDVPGLNVVDVIDVIERERRNLRRASAVLASLSVSLEYLKDQIDAGNIADVARELIDGATEALDRVELGKLATRLQRPP